jgi:hypothetical protein
MSPSPLSFPLLRLGYGRRCPIPYRPCELIAPARETRSICTRKVNNRSEKLHLTHMRIYVLLECDTVTVRCFRASSLGVRQPCGRILCTRAVGTPYNDDRGALV